jgi:hypothetical protein
MILAPIGLVAVRGAWRGLDRRADAIPVAAETVA